MGSSLDEIKNRNNQIIADAKKDIPAIIGIPENAVEVPNLNSNKLQGKTFTELMNVISQYIGTSVDNISSTFGKLNSLNGVQPDAARDITVEAIGDIQIVPDLANHKLLIFGHTGINGMVEVTVDTVPDGNTRIFHLTVPSGFIEGPELMFFYNGSFMTQGVDFSFDKYNYNLSLSQTFPETPAVDDELRCFIYRNGAVNQGLLRINYSAGAIDGVNTEFTFEQGNLSSNRTLVFKNGQLLKCTKDYNVSNGNLVSFVDPPSVNSYLEFINMVPYGGLLEEVIPVGTIDGTNTEFSLGNTNLTMASAFVWVNNILQNRFNSSYTIANDKLSLTVAPSEGSIVRVFKINTERNIVSINGLLPDDLKNISILAKDGMQINTDYASKSIVLNAPIWCVEKFDNFSGTAIALGNAPIETSVIIHSGTAPIFPDQFSVTQNTVNLNESITGPETIRVRYQYYKEN